MTADQWIVVPNWDRFQHYKDRDPTWIKLYTRLLHDEDYLSLTHVERSVLTLIWLEFAAADGVYSAQRVRLIVHRNVRQQCIDSLAAKGFIEVVASKPLALRYQRASPETETEKESPKPPYRENSKGNICPDCGVTTKGARSLAEHVYHSHDGPEPEHWLEAEQRAKVDA